MSAAIAADAVLVLHFLFILFATLGGALVAWRPQWAWLHLPALAWALWIEVTHGLCPLTPLENALRARSGSAGYPGGFVEHYLVPLIYPAGLEPGHQFVLAALLAAVNLLLYGWALSRHRPRQRR